jgi:hypothetical protein
MGIGSAVGSMTSAASQQPQSIGGKGGLISRAIQASQLQQPQQPQQQPEATPVPQGSPTQQAFSQYNPYQRPQPMGGKGMFGGGQQFQPMMNPYVNPSYFQNQVQYQPTQPQMNFFGGYNPQMMQQQMMQQQMMNQMYGGYGNPYMGFQNPYARPFFKEGGEVKK